MRLRPTIRSCASPFILVLALATLLLQLYTYVKRPRPTEAEAAHLMSVLKRFSEDRYRAGPTPRTSIAIEELITSGYLNAKEVRPVRGVDVTFSSPDLDHNPKQILIKLNLRGSGQVWLLGDGTIRRFLPP
jgi:hypothetical protein